MTPTILSDCHGVPVTSDDGVLYCDQCHTFCTTHKSKGTLWQALDAEDRDYEAPTESPDPVAFDGVVNAVPPVDRVSTPFFPDKDAGWEGVARHFHEVYERLAPSFGYETRADTKAFDPQSKNGKLMTAVVEEVCRQLLASQERKVRKEEKEQFRKRIVEEIATAHFEGTPTARLTALYESPTPPSEKG